jgi:hypothetical protein
MKIQIRAVAKNLAAVIFVVLGSIQAHAVVTTDFVIISRAFERLVIATAGILSLWMGYRLFRALSDWTPRAPRNTATHFTKSRSVTSVKRSGGPPMTAVGNVQGALEAKLGEAAALKLTNVGPGIFFAFFGVALLSYLLYTKVDVGGIDNHVNFENPLVQPKSTKQQAAQLARAILTIERAGLAPADNNQTKIANEAALGVVKNFIPNIIDSAFGQGAYRIFDTERIARQNSTRPPVQSKEYDEISEIVSGGI